MRKNKYTVRQNSTISKSNSTIDILLSVLRVLFGCVFVFSGFVKVIDPLGFTYKIEDYLIAFGDFYMNFTFLALPASILLSTFELVLGLNLIFKVRYQLTTLFALLFMAVMTVLTLYIAIANPVTDCGCFGDAVVISNTATFVKNLFLLAFALILFFSRERIRSFYTPTMEWGLFSVFVAVGIGLGVYCYSYFPLIDFRPYKIGTNITEAMQVPEGYPKDRYEVSFIYEKDGVKQEFSTTNYPKNDSTWRFVDQKSVLVEKGYEAPIHDFSMTDEYGDDITEDVLSESGYTFLLITYDVNKASEKGLIEAQKMYNKAILAGHKFYALTASNDDDIEKFRERTGISYSFLKTDPITLKTIIRSNPGILLLKEGTVESKWAWRNFYKIEVK